MWNCFFGCMFYNQEFPTSCNGTRGSYKLYFYCVYIKPHPVLVDWFRRSSSVLQRTKRFLVHLGLLHLALFCNAVFLHCRRILHKLCTLLLVSILDLMLDLWFFFAHNPLKISVLLSLWNMCKVQNPDLLISFSIQFSAHRTAVSAGL